MGRENLHLRFIPFVIVEVEFLIRRAVGGCREQYRYEEEVRP